MREASPTTLLVISFLFVALLGTVAYARALDSNLTDSPVHSIGNDFESSFGNVKTVPWPGTLWFERIGEDPANQFIWEGRAYKSVYEAFLTPNGDWKVHPVKNFNAYINSFIVPTTLATKIGSSFGTYWGHYVLCYIRNFVASLFVYYGTASVFHYHCYIHPRSQEIFKDRARPSKEIIWDQIKFAQASIFIYDLLPIISEYLIEEGYTQAYYSISDIGGFPSYVGYTLLYFTLVEIGIYWMHRTLHTNKFLYKHIHMPHHKYSRPDTLTPWASIAFHPLDGMLQACPYVLVLPIVPCHYLTHLLMVFFTAVWATYIHDAMDWNVDPIMGSKYHTIHHTHYIYNYGQIFTFCDSIWGTLRVPVGKTGVKTGPKKVKLVNPGNGFLGSGRGNTKKKV